jgi:hypothetical protein
MKGGIVCKYKLFNESDSLINFPCHYPCQASGEAAEKRDSANLSEMARLLLL